jgi:hypothetical protein
MLGRGADFDHAETALADQRQTIKDALMIKAAG